VKINAPKRVFRYLRDNEPDALNSPVDGSTYEATFPLPDDGTPGSERHLRIRVTTHTDTPSEVALDIVLTGLNKVRHVGCFETRDIGALADLLYPEATKITKTYLIPVVHKSKEDS